MIIARTTLSVSIDNEGLRTLNFASQRWPSYVCVSIKIPLAHPDRCWIHPCYRGKEADTTLMKACAAREFMRRFSLTKCTIGSEATCNDRMLIPLARIQP